jgi:hypothetical protein
MGGDNRKHAIMVLDDGSRFQIHEQEQAGYPRQL